MVGWPGSSAPILIVAGLVASLAAFVVRFRRSRDEERQQLRWVGVSLGFAVPLFLVGAALWGVVPGAQVLPALALLALPTGIAVAILKYRLYEIDLVVNRALVYGVMTVGVVVGYVAVVGLVGAALSPRGDLVVSLVVTGVVAVCFQPLRATCAALRQPADVRRARRSLHRARRARQDARELAAARCCAPDRRDDRPDARTAVRRDRARGRHDAQSDAAAEYGTPGLESLAFPLVHQGARSASSASRRGPASASGSATIA